jgi:3-oxoacyl-[acyl-carrier protein] reductase
MTQRMPENVLASMVDHTPVPRLGQPQDVAHAYLFLASEEAGFINGAVLNVDGGLVLGT